MSAPDLTQKVLGFREWQVVDGQLTAYGRGHIFWTPGANRARCFPREPRLDYMASLYGDPKPRPKPKQPCSEPPGHGCQCGMYGLHTAPTPRRLGEFPTFDPDQTTDWTIGAILAWGRMEVHGRGFRAEYAEPVLLAFEPMLGRRHVERVKECARYYGASTCTVEELERRAPEYGSGVPRDLYPALEGPKPAEENPYLAAAQALQKPRRTKRSKKTFKQLAAELDAAEREMRKTLRKYGSY